METEAGGEIHRHASPLPDSSSESQAVVLTPTLVLAIMASMLADATRLPFSFHQLIAEAKRRARQRRLLLVIAVAAALAVPVVTAEFMAGSSAPVSRSSAPGCARTAGPAAATSTGSRYAVVHQDEVTMLCLVLPPPRAQLLTREPAFIAREGQILGVFPKPYAPYARHRFWRVHSPLAAVVTFEKAHPPAGSSDGCGPRAPSDCGVGVRSGPNVPPNASLQFNLPPIPSRVGSRVLSMEIVGLPDGWTAIRVDAVNRPWTRGA
jgi:hypothetical protein